MNLTSKLFCLFQLILLVYGKNILGKNVTEPQPTKRQVDVDPDLARQLTFPLSKGLNQFNNDLFPKLADKNKGNIVISPFSIHTALSMTLIGSPTNSSTHRQLSRALFGEDEFDNEAATIRLVNFLKVINFYENEDRSVKIKVGNKAYVYEGLAINKNYGDVLKQFFKSGIQQVNFEDSLRTAKIINDYVDDVTDGLIDKIVAPDSLTSDTRLMLVNAIYFKADWLTKFKERDTKPMKFKVKNGLEIDYKHGMNMKSDLYYANTTNRGFPAQILELPYENENFRMLLILPNENINIEALDFKLIDFDSNTRLVKRKVQLRLPRFKMEFETGMVPFLKELDITDLFNNNANLNDIADEPLYVSDVTHKAVIEVNEEGSEAAAVTVVQIATKSAGFSPERRPIQMIFDRPFYFIIQDKTHKLNLFMGRIVDPSGVHKL